MYSDYINNHKKLSHNAKILSIGTLSKNITNEIDKCLSIHFNTIENAVEYIIGNVKDAKIFLKSSRSMKFERIIELLK